jgi:hypothetical protein
MKHLKFSLFSVVSLAGAVALTGCSGSFGFPDASVNSPISPAVSPGNISGSNFGGHAPIVNAKVFMLQVSSSGYGMQATSLINSSGGTADTSIVGGTSTNPTAYYVTTDAAGGFNIPASGYNCTPGYPVYLYAYGGAPDTNPAVGPSYITSATGNGTTTTFTVGNEKFYVGQQVTFQGIPTGNPFVSLDGGVVGGQGTDQAGAPQTVTGIGTSGNTTFTINFPYSGTTAAGAFGNNSIVSPIGAQNPGIVNLAVLGTCPSTQTAAFNITGVPVGTSSNVLTGISASDIAKLSVGDLVLGPGIGPNFVPTAITAINSTTAPYSITLAATDTGGNGVTSYPNGYSIYTYNFESGSATPINYVYMNEVSTVAAAFAMAPFAETNTIGANGVVTRTGTDAQHIGANGGPGTLSFTGLVNAATNAGQLYDIQGVSNSYTTTDGESHVARTYVPNSGGDPLGVNPSTSVTSRGIAKVPTALIDTLGNILASCVDSNNTYGLGATGGTASSACMTLFETATSNGVPVGSLGATTPKDIATAAINIAHYPAGNGQGTNGGTTNPYTSALIALQGTIFPFVPALPTSTTPNDFVIGLNITVPQGATTTNYLGSSGTVPAAAIPTAIATDQYGDAFVGTTGCGTGTESATNGFGCVLQLGPTQLLPALPTVGGVGLAQGVKSISLGPSGKLWATGAYVTSLTTQGVRSLESGQTVGGYTPPAGGFYIVVNTPSPTNPITYGTVAGGTSSTSYNFAAFGNTLVNSVSGPYTSLFEGPAAIAVTGAGQAFISDYNYNTTAPATTSGYLHFITGVNNGGTSYSYNSVNLDSDYLLQGPGGTGVNCLAGVTALAIGSGTSSGNGSYRQGAAYNVWATSTTGTQGMCTNQVPATGGLAPAVSTTPPINTLTVTTGTTGDLLEETGPQYGPTSVAVDATDVAWDANQSPGTANINNQTGEGFPNDGVPNYGTQIGFARNGVSGTYGPSGVAIDGNNNQWYTNLGSNSVSAFTSPGYVLYLADNPTGISPAGTAAGAGNGGYTASGTMSGPSAIAIDPSGDVWVTNTTSSGVGYSVTELIGVAAPTYVPLSAAASVGKLGAKP